MSPKGFASVVIVIIIAAVLLIGGIFLFAGPTGKSFPFPGFQPEHDSKISSSVQWPDLWGPPDNQTKCQKKSAVKFSSLPITIEDISHVEPIGELREGHIIPGDHAGIDYKTSPATSPVGVFAPADGFLVRVEKHPYDPPQGYPRDIQHYHIYLEHSCTFFTGFVHLTEFSPEILASSGELDKLTKDKSTEQKWGTFRIPIKAGQQLGTAWSFGLLGWVTIDLTHTNQGYLSPQSYKGENWRIHSVSGFDYLENSLKEKTNSKNPRTKEPRGGKIDFDIEGKLVGGWFEKGTGGFRNLDVAPKQCGNFPCPYWDGHIAFVYDYIDPGQPRVSVGYNWGLANRTPFGIKDNSPDFKDIGVEQGSVKYELVALKDLSKERGYDTESPLITENDDSQVLGTLLVQVIDQDTVKVEIFPSKTKDQVSRFTSNARTYTR